MNVGVEQVAFAVYGVPNMFFGALPMRTRSVNLLVASILLALAPTPASSESCSGCACRGGPGYRDAKGQCVGHAQLYSRCGVPPTTRCTFEGGPKVGRSAVPPDWTPAQHTQWLAQRSAASPGPETRQTITIPAELPAQ